MGYYKLFRQKEQGKAVLGTIKADGNELNGIAVPTIENSDYIIPAGSYRVKVTLSPRFKRNLPLLLNVPGRNGIRVHRGTKPEHSKGCIIVPVKYETLLTELWLNEQKHYEKTCIEIIDCTARD